MARYIHCEKCKNRMSKSAQAYGELYEFIEGGALQYMLCDGCSSAIKKDEPCFASVLLNDRDHPNYEKHKPESWASGYIKVYEKS